MEVDRADFAVFADSGEDDTECAWANGSSGGLKECIDGWFVDSGFRLITDVEVAAC